MDLDNILKNYVGEMGQYQAFVLIFASSVALQLAFNNIDYAFVAAIPHYRCDIGNVSQLESNLTFEELTSLSSPPEVSTGKYDSCLVYDRNYSVMTVEEAWQYINGEINNTAVVVTCSSWVYSQEVFTSTIVTEWDLVCDKAWMVATSQSIIMAGLVTTIIGGWLSDRLGRRRVALGCFAINCAARLTCGLAPNYYVYVVARFFLAAAGINWYTVGFVIAVEAVGPKWRVFAGQVPYYVWSVGFMVLPCMAYLIRDWRTLILILLLSSVPYVFHICFLPESIRWLQSQDRHEEANKIINRMARLNKKQVPEKAFEWKKLEKEDKGSWRDLFKSAVLIRNTLMLIFIWFATIILYYGLIFYLPSLGGNVFVSTLISGALEIPALIYVQLTLDTRLGRRYNTCLTLILSSVVLFALVAIPKDIEWLVITLALIGRFAVTSTFSTIFVYTAEIYPTALRGFALSICQTISRIGAILSPYLALMGNISFYLPPIIFGSLSLIAGVMAFFLPETRGTALVDKLPPQSHKESFLMSVDDKDDDQLKVMKS